MEVLEDRILLDSATGIVVGRTLSAFSTADVQNNQVSITYTVYNQEADPITGVLLTDTLQSGVTFQGASNLPDRNGPDLAWSLGTINGFDRASVTLTVSLTSPTPLVLDNGARAYAILNAGLVSDDVPAAVLTNRIIPSDQLASTPDANTTDPFIQEQAAVLDYDPQRIFDYLRTEVGYESYVGSLRGARGTLWSAAGNALDEASLGVALFRASGIPARYAQGTLADPQAKQLILSMFPPSFQTVGYIPAGTAVADPANDPTLLSETRQHYWVQFDTGGGFRDADTTFDTATLGQTFTTPTGTFAEVADGLRHKVEVKLDVETYSQAGALIGLGTGLSTATALDRTFNSVDLVGRSLSLGHSVGRTAAAFTIGAVTNTYSPFLTLMDEAQSTDAAVVMRGIDYQDVLTNFAFGTQLVTGVFLNVNLSGPDGPAQPYSHTVVDRIGYDIRQNGGRPNLTFGLSSPPIISPFDVITVLALPGFRNPTTYSPILTELKADSARLAAEPSANVALAGVVARAAVATNYATGGLFAGQSQESTKIIADSFKVRGYNDRAKIIIVSNRVNVGESGNAASTMGIDILRNEMRAIPYPGQSTDVVRTFNAARGVFDSMAEGDALPNVGANGEPIPVTTTAAVFEAARTQGVRFVLIDSDTLSDLWRLPFPGDVKARITAAVATGKFVAVPESEVAVNGQPTVAWYEIDPDTGYTVGIGEDGKHAAGAIEIIGAVASGLAILYAVTYSATFVIGYFRGLEIEKRYEACRAKNNYDPGNDICIINFKRDKKNADADFAVIDTLLNGPGKAGVRAAIAQAAKAANLNPGDPPIPTALLDPGLPPSESSGVFTVPTGATLTAGVVSAALQPTAVQANGELDVSWQAASTAVFSASALTAGTATVRDRNGAVVGVGSVALTNGPSAVTVTGTAAYAITGRGALAYYPPTAAGLAASADWVSYSAQVTGSLVAMLVTDGLMLNGMRLPTGEYTITTVALAVSGSGRMATTAFAGSATVQATNSRVTLSGGTGTLSVGGQPVDPQEGTTFTGYTGSLGVSSGALALDGAAADVLRLTTTPTALSADQNTPAAAQVRLGTSQVGGYEVTVVAPDGWNATLDGNGMLTVLPAPGTPSGSYAVRVFARSQTDPAFVSQALIPVTVTPTAPGLTLSVTADTRYTVPYSGAQVPSAYQVTLRNLGPAEDTFAASIPNPPAGFNLLRGGAQVTLPAGETGVIGLYLEPSGQLPPPGTVVTFDVTATSTTTPAITQTRTVTFTVPQIHGIILTTDRPALGTTPGTAANVALTLKSVGNVAESVALTATLPTGLTLGGMSGTVPLTLGGSQTLNLTLTPDTNVPLNSTLAGTITATFVAGELGVQTLTIPVRVVAPGADAAANAAANASLAGLTDLGNRLNDLATGITNLFQTTDSAVFKAQILAALDAVAGLVAADFFLGPLVPAPTAARAALVAATTADEVRAALDLVGDYLEVLEPQFTAVSRHGFEAGLFDNAVVVQPNVVNRLPLFLRNTGTQTTTYDLTQVGGFGSPGFFRNNQFISSVTLQPGQVIAGGDDGISLMFNSSTNLPFNVDVIVTARPAPQLVRRTSVSVTQRQEFVAVASVDAAPPFTDPGPPIALTARLLNGLNTEQEVRLVYVVTDAQQNVAFTSSPVTSTLPAQGTTMTAVALPPLPTTGLTPGEYTVTVTVTTPAGDPIPGGDGSGRVRIGTPVTAALSVSPDVVTTGPRVAVNTLTLTAMAPLTDPLTLAGQVAVTPRANSVAVIGTVAYVAGTDGVDVVDVTDPTNPIRVRTFAQNEVVLGGFTIVRDLPGDFLAVASTVTLNATGFDLLVYSLTDPLNPTLVSDTRIAQRFLGDFEASGTTALVSSFGDFFFGGNPSSQIGDVTAIDLAASPPTITDRLLDTGAAPSTGDTHHFGIALADADTAYVAGTTLSQFNFGSGVGQLRVVNFAAPANLTLTRDVQIPGTRKLYQIALDGDRALVVGTTASDSGGVTNRFNPGFLTLTTLDVTDRDNPVVLSTEITQATFSAENTQGGFPKLSVVPVGGGRFAVSRAVAGGSPAILLVDASNPTDIRTAALTVNTVVDEMTASAGRLFTASADGLLVYDIGEVQTIPLTASLRVPTTGGSGGANRRPNTFNLAPDRIIPGASFETLEWDRVLGAGLETETFRFEMNVDPREGGFTETALGGTVAFTSQGTPGTVTLPPVGVAALSFLNLTPAAQSVVAGAPAQYTVSINEPFLTNTSLNLHVTGVPASWVNVPATLQTNAQGMGSVTLTITPDALTDPADYGFTVEARVPSFSRDVVGGTLTVTAPPAPDEEARGVVVALTPAQATAGQGTSAVYTVRVTNTGSAADTFNLALNLPAGVSGQLERASVEVPPGVGNFRDVRLVLTPGAAAALGDLGFSVAVTSVNHAGVTANAAGTLTVVSNGVDVTLDRSTASPGDTLQLTVSNTGTVADTFDLSLAGPAALVSALATNRVTLAPGASQIVAVTTAAVDFAVPGTLHLVAIARSQSNSSVADMAEAELAVAGTMGMTAQFTPDSKTLAAPGSASFLLTVSNSGNREDSYEAFISGVTVGLTASLVGLDGLPVQRIPLFRLPGLSTGAILLQANSATVGHGEVTVEVRSLTDGSLFSTQRASLTLAAPPTEPTPTPVPSPTPAPRPAPPPPDLRLPGVPGKVVRALVKFVSTKSLFKSEVGVIILDADGTINGVVPGTPGFWALALGRRKVLVRRGQRPGAINTVVLQGGQQLLFYLVQNNRLDAAVAANPENTLSGRPLIFVSSADHNPDRKPHLRLLGGGKNVKLRWEDLSRGDQDFNDVVLALKLG